MSFFTALRDAIESVGVVAGNFVLPGSSLITSNLVSEGAQEHLNSDIGQIANLGAGVAGGFAGNVSNYGRVFDEAGNLISGGAPDLSQLPAEALNAKDPIEAMYHIDSEGEGWTKAAQKYGYKSPEGLLGAINPAWANIPLGGGYGPGGLQGGGLIPGGGGAGGTLPGGLSLGGNPITNMMSWAKGTGAMPWGSPGNIMTMGSGIYGLMQANQLKKMAMLAQQKADPWGESGGRALAGGQLQTLLQDPSGITKMPGYEAGLQAIQRSMAAQGYTGSGNMMTALSKYGGDFYNNAVSQLGGLAGAGVNPGSASQIGLTGATNAASIGAQSLNRLGYGVQSATKQMTPQQLMQLQATGMLQ